MELRGNVKLLSGTDDLKQLNGEGHEQECPNIYCSSQPKLESQQKNFSIHWKPDFLQQGYLEPEIPHGIEIEWAVLSANSFGDTQLKIRKIDFNQNYHQNQINATE